MCSSNKNKTLLWLCVINVNAETMDIRPEAAENIDTKTVHSHMFLLWHLVAQSCSDVHCMDHIEIASQLRMLAVLVFNSLLIGSTYYVTNRDNSYIKSEILQGMRVTRSSRQDKSTDLNSLENSAVVSLRSCFSFDRCVLMGSVCM